MTVYRTLEILESLGLVRKLHLAEGCHSYVLRTVGQPEQATDPTIAWLVSTAITSFARNATERWSSRAATSRR